MGCTDTQKPRQKTLNSSNTILQHQPPITISMQALFTLANHHSASPWFTQQGRRMILVERISVGFFADNMTTSEDHHSKAYISNVQNPANSFFLVLALNLSSFNHSPIYSFNMSKISGIYHGRRVLSRVSSRIPHRSGRPSSIPVTRMIEPSRNYTETSNKRQAKHAKTTFQNTDSHSISNSLSDPVKWSAFKNELNATMDSTDFSDALSDLSSTETFSKHRSIMLESPPAGIYLFQAVWCHGVTYVDFTPMTNLFAAVPPNKRNRIEDDGGQMFSIHPSNSKPGINPLRKPVLHSKTDNNCSRRPVLLALECGSQVKEQPYERQRSILDRPEINLPAGFFWPATDSSYGSSNSHSLSSSPVFRGIDDSIDPALKILTPSFSPTSATPPTENTHSILSSPVFWSVDDFINPALKTPTASTSPTSATPPNDNPAQPSTSSFGHSYKNTSDHYSSKCSCHQIMEGLLEEIHIHFERLTKVLVHFKN
ncbi:uncharacterized protein MELLADRAFT_86540 [Melampsora larici-populina 98AG31]|uniref:Uncharacterized protein n=1 Tax=Melampsora larici-populina (strain 98AG31 / pathotype 3-4-7) TaxID=747676 RepID=F4RM64_MELLP|nr:uncharacterized protein MELLADRAFT_86540 [Melampsora larici-populina 98AG31]EGG06368.1 hypothetical protein MELLADRAFT_86540 [Melampsora larici-populina 98AG31]